MNNRRDKDQDLIARLHNQCDDDVMLFILQSKADKKNHPWPSTKTQMMNKLENKKGWNKKQNNNQPQQQMN